MRLYLLAITILVILGGVSVVVAQQGNGNIEEDCPTLAQQAMVEIGNTCSTLGRNLACYGAGDVEASFIPDPNLDDLTFESPGDREALTIFQTIRTLPFVDGVSDWGIAVLSVQANLPGVLPGQAVTVLLMGNTEIENAVAPEDAFIPVDPITVITISEANLRATPNINGTVIGSVTAETTIEVDGTNSDGTWLRLYWEGRLGWIATSVLETTPDIATLPQVTNITSFTPMQAFYLRTGVNQAGCTQAPSALVAFGPEEFLVDINVNGANVQFEDAVIVRTVSEEDAPDDASLLRITVDSNNDNVPAASKLQDAPTATEEATAEVTDQPDIEPDTFLEIIAIGAGDVVVNAGQDDEVIIPSGASSFTCLSSPQNLGIDGERNDQLVTECGWTEPQVVSYENVVGLEVILSVPEEVAPQAVDVILPPTPTPTITPTPILTITSRPTIIQTATPTRIASATATPLTATSTFTPNLSLTQAAIRMTQTANAMQATVNAQLTLSAMPTFTPSRTSTITPWIPTNTLSPSNTPTITPWIPTNTPLPPTNTPAPTNTPLPPTNTPAPTNTPLPPTNTPFPTNTP